MGLRARRPGTNAGQGTVQGAVQQGAQVTQGTQVVTPDAQATVVTTMQQPAQPQYQQQPPVQEAVYQQPAPQIPQQQYQPTQTAGAPAVQSRSAVADLNAGILENVEDMEGAGNYVTVDGTDFLYKDTNETTPEISIVVASGKRFYQWVDESDPENKQYHNSDKKLDSRYKLKFEIRWFEQLEEGAEPTEYIMTLSTTSAINFINYVQNLAKKHGKGVGNVVTKMTISRQTSQDGKNRYSRVEFENVGDAV